MKKLLLLPLLAIAVLLPVGCSSMGSSSTPTTSAGSSMPSASGAEIENTKHTREAQR